MIKTKTKHPIYLKNEAPGGYEIRYTFRKKNHLVIMTNFNAIKHLGLLDRFALMPGIARSQEANAHDDDTGHYILKLKQKHNKDAIMEAVQTTFMEYFEEYEKTN